MSSKPPTRTVSGDYMPVMLLSDGSVGTVTPLRDAKTVAVRLLYDSRLIVTQSKLFRHRNLGGSLTSRDLGRFHSVSVFLTLSESLHSNNWRVRPQKEWGFHGTKGREWNLLDCSVG